MCALCSAAGLRSDAPPSGTPATPATIRAASPQWTCRGDPLRPHNADDQASCHALTSVHIPFTSTHEYKTRANRRGKLNESSLGFNLKQMQRNGLGTVLQRARQQLLTNADAQNADVCHVGHRSAMRPIMYDCSEFVTSHLPLKGITITGSSGYPTSSARTGAVLESSHGCWASVSQAGACTSTGHPATIACHALQTQSKSSGSEALAALRQLNNGLDQNTHLQTRLSCARAATLRLPASKTVPSMRSTMASGKAVKMSSSASSSGASETLTRLAPAPEAAMMRESSSESAADGLSAGHPRCKHQEAACCIAQHAQ